MPKIPDFQPMHLGDAAQYGSVPTQTGTETATALGQVAGQAEGMGFDLLNKRKEAQDQDYVFSQTAQRQRELAQYTDDLQKKMPLDYKGYTDAVQSWVNDRFLEDQKAAPSEDAKQMYIRTAGSVFNHAIVQATGEENKQRAVAFQVNIKEDSDKYGNLLTEIPNVDQAVQWREEARQRIKAATGNAVGAETAHLLDDHAGNAIGKGLLEGLYAKGLGDQENGKTYFKQALDMLMGTGTIRDSETGLTSRNLLLDNLKPHERAAYIDKFERAMNQQKSVDLTEFNKRLGDNIVAASQGKDIDPKLVPDLVGHVNAGDIEKDQGIRYFDNIISHMALGELQKKMALTSPNEWAGIVGTYAQQRAQQVDKFQGMYPGFDFSAAKSPNFNEQSRHAVEEARLSLGASIQKARNDDPAQFVLDNVPAVNSMYQKAQSANSPDLMRSAINNSIAWQAKMGIQKEYQSILPKSEMDRLSQSTALNSPDPTQVYNTFNKMKAMYGDMFPNAFNELVENKKVDAKLWVASFMSSSQTRQRTIQNIVNAQAVNAGFEKAYGSEMAKQLEEEVRSQTMTQYMSHALVSGSGSSIQKANAIQDVVTLEAKQQLIRQGAPGSSVNVKDAVKTAATILSDRPMVARHDALFHVPPGINAQIAEDWAASHKSPEALDTMSIRIPPGTTKEEYYRNISRNGAWYNDPSGNSIRLELSIPGDSRRRPVEALDKDGNVIRVEKDLKETQTNYDKFHLKQMQKGPLRKLIEDKVFTGGEPPVVNPGAMKGIGNSFSGKY